MKKVSCNKKFEASVAYFFGCLRKLFFIYLSLVTLNSSSIVLLVFCFCLTQCSLWFQHLPLNFRMVRDIKVFAELVMKTMTRSISTKSRLTILILH